MTRPFVDDNERSLALQKYIHLQDRQQSIIRRLSSSSNSSSNSASSPTNALTPWLTTSTASHPSTSSTIPSPPRSPTGSHSRNHHRGGRSARSSRSSPPPFGPEPTRRRLSMPTAFAAAAALCSEDAIDDAPLEHSPTTAAAAEADLLELNNDMKATLTTLLNLPSVRRDEGGEMRAWVQERLMDAEMEIKRLRRGCRGGVALVQ